MNIDSNSIAKLVTHQLKSFYIDIREQAIFAYTPKALEIIEMNFKGVNDRRFWSGKEVLFSPYISIQWMNFLYRLSHELFLAHEQEAADQVYYLNKILHSNDWYYAIELPIHFSCEHPLGSVLGRAKYGDYLFIYQGTTIGGNVSSSGIDYPIIGDNVICFANSSILGRASVGNNVVVAADTFIINEGVPDNCIVFGKSPNLVIKKKNEDEIKQYMSRIWGW